MLNRKNIVQRNNPVLTSINPNSPLSIGNGEIAFTADVTGFQTLEYHEHGAVPLCTMSQWGFHSYPSDVPRKERYSQFRKTSYHTGTKTVGYMDSPEGQEDLFDELRISPHRANLIRIALVDLRSTSESDQKTDTELTGCRTEGVQPGVQKKTISRENITSIHQELDLWSGVLQSQFTLFGHRVQSQGLCHPDTDALGFTLSSSLLEHQAIGVVFRFPYPSHEIHGSQWGCPDSHGTEIVEGSISGEWLIRRTIDELVFTCVLKTDSTAKLVQLDTHELILTTSKDSLTFTVEFQLPDRGNEGGAFPEPDWQKMKQTVLNHWTGFWENSAFIDFSGCTDPRARELERRIILSRYLISIQSSGSLPPAETGLTCNSWYGKFHLEMHFWHAAFLPLWGQSRYLERSMQYYRSIASEAYNRAQEQGYRGLRWPKMTDPSGLDSPSSIGVFLCWQQPHFILLADLLFRCTDPDTSSPGKSILNDYSDLVFATADFMADYGVYDSRDHKYHLNPPLIPAQENHLPTDTRDPVFELEYWRLGLQIASRWKGYLGETIPEQWQKVLSSLAPAPIDIQWGGYASHAACRDTYGTFAKDHPSFLMAYSYFGGEGIDRDSMARSLDLVRQKWDFNTSWGWDFPVLAMAAARLGRPEQAIEFLLMEADKNTWSPNGHNNQHPKADLPLYLPGNGALLLAVAMMAGGWLGSQGKTPGFPDNGTWNIHAEGFKAIPY